MILFVGCSYTWGSGLQYEYLYNEKGWSVDKLNKHLPTNTNLENLSYNADEYRKQNNWPNLVSKELNKSFAIGTYYNGGSNLKTIKPAIEFTNRVARMNSIDTIVVQFTDWLRDIDEQKIKNLPDTSIQEFMNEQITLQIRQVVSMCNEVFNANDPNFNHLPKSKYPTWFGLSWRKDLAKVLKNLYPKNFIPIYYQGKEYDSFTEIDNGLRLCDSIIGVQDEHLNSTGCKVVANSIVKKLKKY